MYRFFDILFSGLAIILLLPLMLPLALLLKCTGEHYIFYCQKRIGRYGKEFSLFKFATMLKDSPNMSGGLYTEKNDPRLLPLGGLLRKTKINELPQLINILIGQMSFVGYRPTVRVHFEGYPKESKDKLYNAKPGLTGIGSIVFRNEEKILQNFVDKTAFHQDIIAPYKASLECWYIDHKNVFTYFKLIILTFFAVVRPSSNLWKQSLSDLPQVPVELEQYI